MKYKNLSIEEQNLFNKIDYILNIELKLSEIQFMHIIKALCFKYGINTK